jgi:hypothetical protein
MRLDIYLRVDEIFLLKEKKVLMAQTAFASLCGRIVAALGCCGMGEEVGSSTRVSKGDD